ESESAMELREKGSWDLWLQAPLAPQEIEAVRSILRAAGKLGDEANRSIEEGSGRIVRDLSRVESEELSRDLRAEGAVVHEVSYDVFFHEFRNVSETLRFSVAGGDDILGPYEIAVRIRPRIDMQSISVRYRLPEYTGLDEEEIEQTHGHLRVPVGTRVRFRMATNVLVERGFLVIASDRSGVRPPPASTAEEREVWPDPGAIALTIEDGRFFGGELVVSESGRYWFQFQDDRGFRSGRPETFRIQAMEDRKPSVRIIAPERVSEQVSPRARVRIAVEVEDDYGIRGGVLEGRYFAPGSDAPVPQSLP